MNLAPAFLGAKFRTYFLTTLIGIAPGTYTYSSLGRGLGVALETNPDNPLETLASGEVILPLVALAVLATLPLIYKKIKACKDARNNQQ